MIDGSTRTFEWEIGGQVIKATLTMHREAIESARAEIIGASDMLARMVEQRDLADARYRAWRANRYLDVKSPEGKPAGWKSPTEDGVKAAIEAAPEFMTHKQAIARRIGDVAWLEGYVKAIEAGAK